jgi:hypothetical protein
MAQNHVGVDGRDLEIQEESGIKCSKAGSADSTDVPCERARTNNKVTIFIQTMLFMASVAEVGSNYSDVKSYENDFATALEPLHNGWVSLKGNGTRNRIISRE